EHHPSTVGWNTRPSGRNLTHLTVSAGATAVMRTVSGSASAWMARMWLPTIRVSPSGPITFVAESYVWEHATRPAFLEVVDVLVVDVVSLERAASSVSVWTATGVGSVQLRSATAAPASSHSGVRERRRTDMTRLLILRDGGANPSAPRQSRNRSSFRFW